MSRLEILEAEYKRSLENPLFDNPAESVEVAPKKKRKKKPAQDGQA